MAEVKRYDTLKCEFYTTTEVKIDLNDTQLTFLALCVSVSGESGRKTAQKSIVCWPPLCFKMLFATIQLFVMVSLQCLRWNSQGINSALKLTATMANIHNKLLSFWLLLKPKCEYAKAHSVLCYMDFLSPSWRLS